MYKKKKNNINDSAVGANVSCTLSKFFSPHLKANFVWLIKFLIICMLWNTATGQKPGWIILEFPPDYRTVRTVSTGLPVLIWEDGGYKGEHSASWQWPSHWDEKWHWSNFLLSSFLWNKALAFNKTALEKRKKKFHLVFLKYWYMFYIYSYMHLKWGRIGWQEEQHFHLGWCLYYPASKLTSSSSLPIHPSLRSFCLFTSFTTQILGRPQEKSVHLSVAKASLWMVAVEKTVNLQLTHFLFVLISELTLSYRFKTKFCWVRRWQLLVSIFRFHLSIFFKLDSKCKFRKWFNTMEKLCRKGWPWLLIAPHIAAVYEHRYAFKFATLTVFFSSLPHTNVIRCFGLTSSTPTFALNFVTWWTWAIWGKEWEGYLDLGILQSITFISWPLDLPDQRLQCLLYHQPTLLISILGSPRLFPLLSTCTLLHLPFCTQACRIEKHGVVRVGR